MYLEYIGIEKVCMLPSVPIFIKKHKAKGQNTYNRNHDERIEQRLPQLCSSPKYCKGLQIMFKSKLTNQSPLDGKGCRLYNSLVRLEEHNNPLFEGKRRRAPYLHKFIRGFKQNACLQIVTGINSLITLPAPYFSIDTSSSLFSADSSEII